MKNQKIILSLGIIFASTFLLSGCGKTTLGGGSKNVSFSNDDQTVDQVTAYIDKFANEKVEFKQTYNLNQEFTAKYKTFDPNGEGTATVKAKSMKEVANAGLKTPDEGKKLILIEIAIRGKSTNKGAPSTFNQVGDTPSPQFVLVDKAKNKTDTETTYYSDGYTEANKLFELSKITMDHEEWVNTAIVFQIDKNVTPDLAFRFINLDGKAEFYDIK